MPSRKRLPKTSARFEAAERRANASRGGRPKSRSTFQREISTKELKFTPGTRAFGQGRPSRAIPQDSARATAAQTRRARPKTDIKAEIKARKGDARRARIGAATRQASRDIHKRQTTVVRKQKLSGPTDLPKGGPLRAPTPTELKGILAMNKRATKSSSKRRRGS